MIALERSLEERLNFVISNNPYLTGRKLRFETESGRVVLKGVVNSYYQKQMAHEAVRRVDGVAEIDNCLEVAWR